MCVCCGKREGGGGQGAGNCKLFDGCVEGKWLVVWGHGGRGAVRQSKRITAKHSSAGRLSHSLSTLLCCFPYHSFYTSFFCYYFSFSCSCCCCCSICLTWSSNAVVVCLCCCCCLYSISLSVPSLSLSLSLSLCLLLLVSSFKLTSYVFPFQLSVCACVSVRSCVLVSFILLVIYTCVCPLCECVCETVMSCEWLTSIMNKFTCLQLIHSIQQQFDEGRR